MKRLLGMDWLEWLVLLAVILLLGALMRPLILSAWGRVGHHG